MTKNKMIELLKEQDEELARIFKEREELANYARDNGTYESVVKALYKDGKSHWEF